LFLDGVEFDPWHSRKPEIDGGFVLNYVGLFSGKNFRVPGFFSGGEGSVSTPPNKKNSFIEFQLFHRISLAICFAGDC
jgi:hypothetical protein